MTIPSIDMMSGDFQTPSVDMPSPIGAMANAAVENVSAFEAAVARFQSAMSEVPLATPETLKAVIVENQTIAEGLKGLRVKGLKIEGESVQTEKASGEKPANPITLQPFNPLTFEAVQQVVAEVKVAATVDAATARTQVLVDAVEAVCDAILVTPGLLRGQGEMIIRLKPDVLAGTEIRLEAKGSTLTVEFTPATPEVATAIERNITQFEQHLAGRIHTYQIAARVNVGEKKLKG